MGLHHEKNPSGFRNLILLLLLSGAVILLVSPAFAGTGVTISADGSQAYYLGEKVMLRGQNTDSDTTYLFLTGPNLPENGAKLSSPKISVVNGNAETFTRVKTQTDKTWNYPWYTAGLLLDAGSYTAYAVSAPRSGDQLAGTSYSTTSLIIKKPFISSKISPATVVKGQPFAVTGIAEGIPPEVQIWIIGNNYTDTTKIPVNSNASYTFNADATMSGKLPTGQNYLVVQHPMADNRFDFIINGEYVRDVKLNNGTNLFRIAGPGSLQGSDAADALITAISARGIHDNTLTHDTYTIIPFQVTDTGSGVSAGKGVTIIASGIRSYYQGEKVVFSGYNYDSDTTYLFITGPGTFMNGPGIPDSGGKLTSPRQEVVSENPGSFDTVKTKADKSWEYVYYTHNLNVDAGTYMVYAVSQPKAKNQLNGVSSANVGIILKKPFLTGEISPSSLSKGESFTVSGTAEGDPESVQIWILGNNYYSRAPESVNSDASYKYEVHREVTSQFESGQYFVIVQHSMQNNMFDIDVTGDYVRKHYLNNTTNLFRISGPGSLQGGSAADALVAAFSDSKTCDDTYTLIPFLVTDAGNPTLLAASVTTAPVQQTTGFSLFRAIGEIFQSFF